MRRTLAVLTLTGVVALWMVFALVLVHGFAQAVDNPARLSFVSEMTGPTELPNAVGLNSALFQVARIVGPALAGVIIVVSGTGWCFALNAVSYAAVIVALLAVDPALLHRSAPVTRAKGQVREGLRYIRDTQELRSILIMTARVGTLAINFPGGGDEPHTEHADVEADGRVHVGRHDREVIDASPAWRLGKLVGCRHGRSLERVSRCQVPPGTGQPWGR